MQCRTTGQQQQASIGSYVLHLLLLGQIGVKKKMTADEPSIVLRQEHMTFRKKPKKNLTSIFQIRNFRLGDQGSTGTKAQLVQMFEWYHDLKLLKAGTQSPPLHRNGGRITQRRGYLGLPSLPSNSCRRSKVSTAMTPVWYWSVKLCQGRAKFAHQFGVN